MKSCAVRLFCSCIRPVFLEFAAGSSIKCLEGQEEVVYQEGGGSKSLLRMDRTAYERPEKRARLTIFDDNGPRVDIYDGVSTVFLVRMSLASTPSNDGEVQCSVIWSL